MVRRDNVIIEDEVTKTATTTSGTETIELPEKGWLSNLNLRAAIIASWADESALNVWQAITKIEVLVNGHKVVKSYDARQLRALAWYHGIELPPLGTYARGGTGDKTFWNFPILFGNTITDRKHMLDLSAYSNPQLKLTWDAAQSTFDGVSRDVSSTPTFRYGLDGLIYRDEPPTGVEGYVKSSQIDSWVTANSATHTTEIPRGQELLGVMIGGRYDSIDTPEFFNNIKLDFDNGTWVALDHGFQQTMGFYATWWPKPVQTAIYESLQSSDTPDPMVGIIDGAAYFDASGNIGAMQISGPEYPLYDIPLLSVTDGSALTGRQDVSILWTGKLPHQCLYIPMHAFTGDEWMPLPTADYGRIDLKTTMGSGVGTSATEKVVAEYIIPNGQ